MLGFSPKLAIDEEERLWVDEGFKRLEQMLGRPLAVSVFTRWNIWKSAAAQDPGLQVNRHALSLREAVFTFDGGGRTSSR
ncbi:MAG TPA: hypothetical protein VGY99_14460 [Candidatus Binataceae bacterium]|jgi:hypothetical protein|nr:hypothetical protein [Candidatus Binataceae bacterium]